MKITYIYLLACLAWLGPVSAAAAPSPTLAELIEQALRHNGEIQTLREELKIAEAGQTRAGLHPEPVLEVGLETGALTGSSGEERLSVGISREFLTFGKTGLQRAVADKELAAARQRQLDAERLLTLAVKASLPNWPARKSCSTRS